MIVRAAGLLALVTWVSPAAPPALSARPKFPVNLFTGTSNSRWMLFPGPTLPFGLVKLSPDNQLQVWNGGYEYTVGSVSGFSHLHALALSGLSIMPFVGNLHPESRIYRVFPGSPDGPFGNMWTAGYRSRILKETERASLGYYGVDLYDYGVRAELTATMHCGMLRLTYPESNAAHLLLDFAFPAEEDTKLLDVAVSQNGPRELTGSVRQSNQYAPDYTVHWTLQLDRDIDSLDTWHRDEPKPGKYGDWGTPVTYKTGVRELRTSGRSGVVLNFHTRANEVVHVRTGLSLVDGAGARNNIEKELVPFGWNFDAVVRHAEDAWAPYLSRVEVSGGTAADREMFYTCLYRSYSAKSVIQDADGRYLDACRKPRRTSGDIYSSDALWGTQWTLAPLWTLINPKLASSWVKFFLQAAENGGWIPAAPVLGGYSPIMGAQHQDALLISAYQKGIRDWDAEKGFAAVKHDLTTPGEPFACGGYVGNRFGKEYADRGYVPDEAGASSNTMEYAYDDYAAGQMALALGKRADYEFFNRRAGSYRNQIDPATRFARRRLRDGSWVTPFDPLRFGTEGGWNGTGFMEGTPWIYTWFVPHDLPGLLNLIGAAEWNRRLEEGFDRKYVDLGNEPNLQAPFLFNYSGKPWLTQKYSRIVLRNMFNTSPLSGWIGEEDEGQLSALFVLMSMGLFEMDGGVSVEPRYDIGSPLFERATIRLDSEYYSGKDFTIEAHGNSERNLYIQSARLNGIQWNHPWIRHADVVRGGKLQLEMGPEPNRAWGTVTN